METHHFEGFQPLNFGCKYPNAPCMVNYIYTYLHWVKNGHIQAKCTSIYSTIHGSYGMVSFQFFGSFRDASLAIFPMFQSFRSIPLEVSPQPPKLQVDKLGPLKKKLCITARHKKKRNGGMLMFFKVRC